MWWWVILPFHDICSFWFVAVSIMDKQLFFIYGYIISRLIVASRHLENRINHDVTKDLYRFQQILVCWCIMVLSSLSVIKSTEICYKTANINIKKQLFIYYVNNDRSKTANIIVGISCWFWTTSAFGTPLFGSHLEQRIYNEDNNK